jgi:hypothetical protein
MNLIQSIKLYKKRRKVKRLIRIFAGKSIQITHKGNSTLLKCDEIGICKTFHNTLDSPSIDIELTNGNRFGFIPDTITKNMAEGKVATWIAGRRKIQLT